MKSVRGRSGRNATSTATAAFLIAVTLYGCQGGNQDGGSEPPENGLSVTVTDPVQRDYAEIKESGVLKMITQYSSNTYFLHQGIEVGFEYELLKAFAREHDLAFEVVIIGENENPYNLLNSGEGDVIAANYTITPERRQVVNFTRPYNLVDQLVVFSDDLGRKPKTLEQIAAWDIPITVRRNSSYYVRLEELKEQGYDLNISVVADEMDTESLLLQVANGNIEATVSDNNMFYATSQYMQSLTSGPEIAQNDTIAWAIRKNAPDLETHMNRFLYKHFRFTDERLEPKRSTFLNILRRRYFEEGPQIAEYYNPELQSSNVGLISSYDDLIRQVADSLNLDWLMLTAMIAQESKFNPSAKSWAGAVGLMQILPRFSNVEYQNLYNPEVNIREGAKIIKEHLDHYAYLDTLDQWAFALATYNVGVGHMADARRIAIDLEKDPNKWENVEDALLKLMQRRFYQDARHGFARGIETVQYVKEVMNRHQMYQRVVTLAEQRASAGTGIFGVGTFNLP
ncbi:MAG: transporter substrate-binding domain-containing protein [Balneolaceae bacterium]